MRFLEPTGELDRALPLNMLFVKFELIDEVATVRLLSADSTSGEMGPLSVPLRMIGEGEREGEELE